tara:strand:+ start:175 stop:321 length:147 start_codon:yes stop_codon:yes gene_type:complete
MAKKNKERKRVTRKKKTSIGNGKFTKRGSPGPHGGNKHYKKPYRGQGK